MEFNKKVFVVTGAGSGIGREVALKLLSYGACVAAVDINEANLKSTLALAGNKADSVELFCLNITDKQAVEALPQKVVERFQKIDGIFNVAGIIQPFISVNELTMEQTERVINVNFYGAYYIIKAFLPILLKNETESLIANVSSMGAFVAVPGQTVYGASKAAVKALTEGLYSELSNTKVRVCGIYPGAVNTNITKNSNVTISVSSEKAKKFKMLEPQRAAEIILDGVRKNKLKILVGKDAKLMDFLSRFFPKFAIKIINRSMASIIKK